MISIIIPTRNEKHLWDTIRDIEKNVETKPEIMWMEDDGKGQRGLMNEMVSRAKGDLIMKLDAHCSMGPGFDTILLEDFEDDMVMAPLLLPLDGKTWTIPHHNQMSSYVFDSNFVMLFNHTPPKERVHETMCMQGSCFMVTKKNYNKWNLCDESLGSWGGQGTEIGIKTFLGGGRCITNKRTYYGHVFRHKETDFPYKRQQKDIDKSHENVLKKLKTKAIAPLIEKYDYPADWTKDKVDALC